MVTISAKWTEWMAKILFSFDVRLSVSVHSGLLNGYSSKTVITTEFKFDVHVSGDSPDMTA